MKAGILIIYLASSNFTTVQKYEHVFSDIRECRYSISSAIAKISNGAENEMGIFAICVERGPSE